MDQPCPPGRPPQHTSNRCSRKSSAYTSWPAADGPYSTLSFLERHWGHIITVGHHRLLESLRSFSSSRLHEVPEAKKSMVIGLFVGGFCFGRSVPCFKMMACHYAFLKFTYVFRFERGRRSIFVNINSRLYKIVAS